MSGGSICTRTGSVALRAVRAACATCSAGLAVAAGVTAVGGWVELDGPEHVDGGEPGRQVVEDVLQRGRARVDGSHPHRGREADFGAGGELRGGVPRGIPAHQRLNRWQSRIGHDEHAATLGVRDDHGRGRHPPTQRLLGDPQVWPGEQRPPVEQQRRAVLGARLRSGGGHHDLGAGRDGAQHGRATAGHADRHPGERATELLGGAPGSDDAGAQPA